MDTPQEVQVWFVLPALRKEYVLAMKKKGLKQKEIASILGLTEPAVSQYLKNKRGSEVCFTDNVLKEIAESSQAIIDNKTDFRTEVQKILSHIKKTKFICKVCHDHIHTSEDCKICYG
ncbi:hypothetical protein JXC34_00710 [Candidatus Woesearchaeota archaeon]|nr:hypothetical protein [Candidatus Woesearchaeota archaeon]